MPEKKYFFNLDGIRTIAALLVIFCHFDDDFHFEGDSSDWTAIFNRITDFNGYGGTTAVHLFFTLSGFLITYLFFFETTTTKHFNFSNFIMRRILRIWPLYFLVVLIGFTFHPLISHLFNGNQKVDANLFLYLGFLSNFDLIFFHRNPLSILQVLWSISVEEQFYFIWPLLIYILSRFFTRLQYFFLFALLFSSLFISFNLIGHKSILKYHSISSLLDFSMGALVAWFSFFKSAHIKRILSHSFFLTRNNYIFHAVAIGILFYMTKWDLTGLRYLFFRLYSSAYFAILIFDQTLNRNGRFQIGNFKTISRIGKISFGLYMYHMIVLTALRFFIGNNPTNSRGVYFGALIATISGTFLISQLSYVYFESFFLKLKSKFYSSR
jgi:peptidoglycan/LPS O-acetylase OafA/YrhL